MATAVTTHGAALVRRGEQAKRRERWLFKHSPILLFTISRRLNGGNRHERQGAARAGPEGRLS
jgi:hypothetical protein